MILNEKQLKELLIELKEGLKSIYGPREGIISLRFLCA